MGMHLLKRKMGRNRGAIIKIWVWVGQAQSGRHRREQAAHESKLAGVPTISKVEGARGAREAGGSRVTRREQLPQALMQKGQGGRRGPEEISRKFSQ